MKRTRLESFPSNPSLMITGASSTTTSAATPASIVEGRASTNITTATPATATTTTASISDQQKQQQHDPNKSSRTSLLSPHTLRLLKLILESTTEHAAEATGLLTRMIAGQLLPQGETQAAGEGHAPSIQLWDMLGRLQEGLTSTGWKTRVQAAEALQQVAQFIPRVDQKQFLLFHGDDGGDGSGSGSGCSVAKGESSIMQLPLESPLVSSPPSSSVTALTGDVTRQPLHPLHVLQVVLSRGRLLFAGPCAKYEKIQHDEQLKVLDRTAQCRDDYVRKRISLQRKILTQRLGLEDIERISGDNFLPEIITGDDWEIDADVGSQNSASNDQHEAAAPSTKRQQLMQAEGEAISAEEVENPLSIRNLLINQITQETKRNGHSRSHRNPQHLLAAELVYRMFDPAWHIRHGAVLGILSLLRAWRLYRKEALDDETDSVLGHWPRDILVRTLCVLALDRFGDFSGALSTSNSLGGSVVAPVREVAGQLLSVLFVMAPRDDQDKTLQCLCQLGLYESEWEPRHGALVAMKFILVALRTTKTSTTNLRLREVWDQIAPAVLHRLVDRSDDVKSAAARLLIEYLTDVETTIPDLVWDAAEIIVRAIATACTVSSCMIDLVELVALLLHADPRNFVSSLGSSTTVNDLAKLLFQLLDSDFPSVRVSSLRSCLQFANFLYQNNDSQAVMLLSQLTERIFPFYFEVEYDSEPLSEAQPRSMKAIMRDECNRLWDRLAMFFTVEGAFADSYVNLETSLISYYFWRREDLLQSRISDYAPFPCAASDALARFLWSHVQKEPHAMCMVIISMLRSPWMLQCEASCLLIRSLCQCCKGGIDLHPIKSALKVMLQKGPFCIRVNGLRDKIQDSAFYESCHEAFQHAIKKIRSHSVSETEFAGRFMWTRLGRYGELDEVSSTTTVASMRLEGLAAGAYVFIGLPEKVTHLVRPLMTCLINETCVQRQRNQVHPDVAMLIKKLGQSGNYAGARRRVLQKVCDLACLERDKKSAEPCEIIGIISRDLSSPSDLTSLEPLWSRLNDWTSTLATLKFLRIVSSGVGVESPLALFIIDSFAEKLVQVACYPDRQVRSAAADAISALCVKSPKTLLSRILPILVSILRDRREDELRVAALLVIHDLVEIASSAICPFVTSLLPVVMALILDKSYDCSLLASGTFAHLVRMAPLVEKTSTISLNISGFHSCSDKVMDHLIFGLPLPEYSLPKNISEELNSAKVRLRDYQVEGIAWLRFLQSVRLNGALCDSMGLGKTLQALVAIALAHEDTEGPEKDLDKRFDQRRQSLVICPSSIVGHWMYEIRQFFPLQSVFQPVCYVGSVATRRRLRENDFFPSNLVVTSYAVLRSDIDYLGRLSWCYCVLDEGHLLRNPRTATALASKRLLARHKTIITGTPIQNTVNEVWSSFDFLMPHFLGSFTNFTKKFARPIMKSQLPNASAESIKEGQEKLKLLHQQVLPFILRREKENVLHELPPKNLTVVRVPLSDLQQKLYNDFCSTKETQESLSSLRNTLNDEGICLEKLGVHVLKTLLFLRLLCTHPSLVRSSSLQKTSDQDDPWLSIKASGKIAALCHLLGEAGLHNDNVMAADNDATLLYFEDKPVSACVSQDNSLDGESYLPLLLETLPCSKRKCLIFSQFTRTLDLVEEVVFRRKMPYLQYLRLDGRVPPQQRADIASRFNKDDDVSVMLLTTRVGGLGLNLTGADTVIILESDFNPFSDLQAIDRAHRIGQKRVVNVYRIIAEATIEEQILELHEKKIAISNAIVNSENSTIYQMGTERLLDIFTVDSASEKLAQILPKDFDLDVLIEEYAEDYDSLSASEFSRTLSS